MSTAGYCPRCEKDVYLVQEKMDTCIIIFLAIFTVGIGLIFYYFMRRQDKCARCGTICRINLAENVSSQQDGEILGTKAVFCTFCGTELNRINQEFCPDCGTKM